MVGRFLFARPSLGTFLVTFGVHQKSLARPATEGKSKKYFDYCIMLSLKEASKIQQQKLTKVFSFKIEFKRASARGQFRFYFIATVNWFPRRWSLFIAIALICHY